MTLSWMYLPDKHEWLFLLKDSNIPKNPWIHKSNFSFFLVLLSVWAVHNQAGVMWNCKEMSVTNLLFFLGIRSMLNTVKLGTEKHSLTLVAKILDIFLTVSSASISSQIN